ncbi:hypothetical protein BASA83_008350 [Batrachochytrium salamandrivorans]|nr:hypothetical protein BASA83_008350 [Batrachochytrium salamandrivorans]
MERQTRSQWCFTHRIREDGEVFSSEEGRETSSDTTPPPCLRGRICSCGRLIAIARFRATPKKARDSPPPQDDLWVVVKNLSQQVAAQQAAGCCATLCSPAEEQPEPGDQWQVNRRSNSSCSGCHLARLEVGPVVPKSRPPTNSWLNASLTFVKAGAACLARSEAQTSVPCTTVHPKWSSPRSPAIYASGFPYAKPGDLRKACREPASVQAQYDIRWISVRCAATIDADYVSAFTRKIPVWTRLSSSPSKLDSSLRSMTRISSLLFCRLLQRPYNHQRSS